MESNRTLLIILCLFAISWGCSTRLPRVEPPHIDVSSAADGALAALDADQDGLISQEESEACAGMRDNWQRYDRNGDGSVERDELQDRFSEWTRGDTGLMNLRAEVVYRGSPLPDAQVELTPYAFLGDNLLPAQGTTDRYGFVFLAIPKKQLPSSQQGTHGVQVGLYRVSVTHPEIELPARYNRETELSVDLSPAESNSGIRLVLRP